MKENQITKLFPEAPGPSIEDFFEVLKFNAVKKLTAILLAFSFLFTPLASAFAQTTTTIPSLESNNTTTPETELITPTPEPNPLPQEQLQPTEESGQIDQQLESEEPPPEMLLDSSDPDPRIETGYKPASPVHADESSGSLLTEYPIAVPPGRNGFQPDLKLQYNSQNSKEIDSQFGAGWGINIPYIERLNKSGLNNIYNNISTTSYFSSSLSGELVASTTASTTYVSRVDNGEFLNYVFSNNVWTATDKKGNRFYFGDPEASLPVELYSTSLYNDANLKQYFRLENTSATIGNNLTNNGSTPFNPGQFANGSDFGFSR